MVIVVVDEIAEKAFLQQAVIRLRKVELHQLS